MLRRARIDGVTSIALLHLVTWAMPGYNALDVRSLLLASGRFLMASVSERIRTGGCVRVRLIFSQVRHVVEHSKTRFNIRWVVLTKERLDTARFALGALFVLGHARQTPVRL